MTQDDSRREVIPIYLRVAPGDIALLKFLFESYEEIGLVRTVDRRSAIIVVLAAVDFLDSVRAIIAEVQQKIDCSEIERPADEGDDWLMREID
ncbi:MAG: DUF4911 domain-containing protein [Deltaproteobacteria bacterium]|nr:DUF4911 domain-containing protein [Deltaproteobacteria bacterium]